MKKSLLLLSLCIACFFSAAQKPDCPKGINSSDSAQLTAFWKQTNSFAWKKTTNWLNFSTTEWYGVRWKTINGECCVDSLILKDNNIAGSSLPNMNFPHLRFLMLSSNAIGGTIPDFDLPELQHLYLSYNKFTGKLPAFSKLKKLEVLYARHNYTLDSQLPLFDLPLLRELRLEACNFKGKVPNWNLPSLEILDLNCNPLDSFSNALVLPKLIDLNLSHIKNLKNAPFFVEKQPNLKILNITGIGFDFFKEKIIFPTLESLTAEKYWNNSNNIPTQFFPNLKKLYIENSLMTGSLSFVKKLPALEILSAGSNRFSSFDLENLEKHPLKVLDLYASGLVGDLANLNAFPQLEKVNLRGNNIHKCSKKVNLPFLKALDVSSNILNFNDLDSLSYNPSAEFNYSPQRNFDIGTSLRFDGARLLRTPINNKNEKTTYLWTNQSFNSNIKDDFVERFRKDSIFYPKTSGYYICTVKNPKYPDLVLTSNPFKFEFVRTGNEGDMVVFPNPTNGLFSVHFYNPIPLKVSVNLYNSIGQVMFQKTVQFPATEELFDLSHLANGTYLMEFLTKADVKYKEIVVVKEKK